MKDRPDPSDELDRRIDGALKRRFQPPASLDTLATRLAPRPRRLWPRLLLVTCAAAALLLLFLMRREDPLPARIERLSPERLARIEPFQCPSVGPLEEARELDPARPQAPDLLALYRTMDACQRSTEAVACDENDELVARLRASYGPEVSLAAGASGLLHGPFASAEWPTATILTGSSEDLTTVLVAERDATVDCCVRLRLAESSGLNVFTWSVGDLALTEISPHDEPRFLQLFE